MSLELSIVLGMMGAAIVIAVLIIFRHPLSALLERIRSAGPEGVVFDSRQQAAAQRSDPRKEAERLLRQLDDQTLVAYENALRSELERLGFLEPSAHAQAIPVLIRYMARLQVDNEFYEIYRTIYGSQLRALNQLNGSQIPIDRQRLEMFLLEAASNHPEMYRNIQFDTWFGFLLTTQLAVHNADGKFEITQRGQSFLAYLIRRRFSQDLPF